MSMLGLKLFADTPVPRAREIINRAIQDGLGLELLLITKGGKRHCSYDVKALLAETRFHEVKNKTLHLDHIRSQGCNIQDVLTQISFSAELADMQCLGISRAVMHYHHALPLSLRHHDILLSNLTLVNAIAELNGVTIYLENTLFDGEPANANFYSSLFELVLEYDLGHLGFCFDLGHAKAFSTDSLARWVALLDRLNSHKVPLHFHLHNNGGQTDEHLSFRQADLRDLNEGDAFSGGLHYVEVVAFLDRRYPGVKLLEVGADEAIPGLDWLQEQMAWRASAA